MAGKFYGSLPKCFWGYSPLFLSSKAAELRSLNFNSSAFYKCVVCTHFRQASFLQPYHNVINIIFYNVMIYYAVTAKNCINEPNKDIKFRMII